jgi:hypothetical protein
MGEKAIPREIVPKAMHTADDVFLVMDHFAHSIGDNKTPVNFSHLGVVARALSILAFEIAQLKKESNASGPQP